MADDAGHTYKFGPPKGGWDYKGKGKAVSETYVTDAETAADTRRRRQPRPAVYIAGPMTGYQDFNFPAFDEASDLLSSRGYRPISPADRDRKRGFDGADSSVSIDFYRSALAWDLQQIAEKASAIYMLRGWEKSPGARAEHAAAVAVGIEVIYETAEF